jgi:hypothetical protein
MAEAEERRWWNVSLSTTALSPGIPHLRHIEREKEKKDRVVNQRRGAIPIMIDGEGMKRRI